MPTLHPVDERARAKPKHSPAPWSLDRGQLRDRDGNALASVPIFPDGIGGPEDLANGQLLAAAPELAGALEALFAGVNAGLTRDELAERGVTTRARLALFKAGGPFDAPDLAAELVDALKAIYRLTGFTFSPDRRSVAVAELAGRALERAGIDPAAVIQGEV